jgi:Flp pilus assembly protein TadD
VQHGLAVALTDTGELEKARKLSQGANKSYEKIFDPDHPHNTNIVTNLASSFSLEGDYADAEGYYRHYLKYLVYHPGQADRRTSTWLG